MSLFETLVFTSPTRSIGGDGGTSSPVTSTIVMGPTEAVLVDAQFIREQVEALADTIAGTGRRLQCDPGSSSGLNATAGRAGPEIAG